MNNKNLMRDPMALQQALVALRDLCGSACEIVVHREGITVEAIHEAFLLDPTKPPGDDCVDGVEFFEARRKWAVEFKSDENDVAQDVMTGLVAQISQHNALMTGRGQVEITGPEKDVWLTIEEGLNGNGEGSGVAGT